MIALEKTKSEKENRYIWKLPRYSGSMRSQPMNSTISLMMALKIDICRYQLELTDPQ
jgi:hypothetical protein